MFCLKLIKNLTLVPFGVVEEAGEKAGLATGDVGTNEGWSRSEVDVEDVEVSEGSGLSCVWVKT